MTFGLTGCASSMQDLHYSLVNKSRAEYAWYSNTTLSQRWNSGSDYAYGYKKGFSDAASGRGCVLPAVPPTCYWSTKYQCCEGQKHIQDWYRGYQCGVAAAQGSGYPSFHNIPVGPQAPVINKDGCGMCYAPNDCLAEHSTDGLPVNGQYESGVASSSTDLASLQKGMIGPTGAAFDLKALSPIRTASAERSAADLPIIR